MALDHIYDPAEILRQVLPVARGGLGLNRNQAARNLGCSVATVDAVRREHGLIDTRLSEKIRAGVQRSAERASAAQAVRAAQGQKPVCTSRQGQLTQLIKAHHAMLPVAPSAGSSAAEISAYAAAVVEWATMAQELRRLGG